MPATPELTPLPIEKQNLPVEDFSIKLSDAVALSLQHSDVVRVLSGSTVLVDPATEYDPPAFEARRDEELAAFDPKISLGYFGSQINEPPSSFFGPGIAQQTRRDEGDFTAALSRLWQTGATSSLSYAPPLGYLFIPGGNGNLFNPIYSSALVAEVRQPLLRGAGKEVNRAPIRIAQLRLEQSAWEFKAAVIAQVRSVEEAYWDLQAAYILLQAIDTVIPLAEEAVRIEEARMTTEVAIRADVARARVQLANFRQQRLRYESSAREKENRLRNLIGAPAVDHARLVPIDPPLTQPPMLDSNAVMTIAASNRPDLVQRRLGLRIRELDLLVAQNGVKPQLDLHALYRANGVGRGLDDALIQSGILDYTDWMLGVTYSIPIGNRAARAKARQTEIQLVRERALLRETVRNVGFRLADIVRDLRYTWNQYQQAQERIAACQEWLHASRVRYSSPPPNMQSPDALLLLLFDYQTALRAYVDAVSDASLLMAAYNGMLARLEEAQGTLLESRGIQMADDPVAAVREQPVPLYLEPLPGDMAAAMPLPAGTPDPAVPPIGWTTPRGGAPDPSGDPYSNYRWTPPRSETPVR